MKGEVYLSCYQYIISLLTNLTIQLHSLHQLASFKNNDIEDENETNNFMLLNDSLWQNSKVS